MVFKRIVRYSLFFIVLVFSSSNFNSVYSQTSIKAKVVDVFTRKKQIIALNSRLDSLQLKSNDKDSTIVLLEMRYDNLMSDYNNLDLKREALDADRKHVLSLNKKYKRQLDSLIKVNEDSKRYSLEQRNADSIRYQTLLQKLSDKNTFVVDSLKRVHEVRRDKQEPARIENYYFKDFKSVISGTPDSKNRFTWTFELFKKSEADYIPAENEEVFNENKDELLTLINSKIKEDFEKAYALDKQCFTTSNAPNYTFKNLGLEFKDGKVNFYAVFDFATENCYYLYGYTVVEFTVEEIEKYLK